MKRLTTTFFLSAWLAVSLTHTASARWTKTSCPGDDDVTAFAVSGGTIFAGSFGGGVFLSADTGATWKAVNSGLMSTNVMSLAVGGGSIFAATYKDIYISTNNGATWNYADSGLTDSAYSLGVNGGSIFAGACHGIYLSTDNGTSWKVANSGIPANTRITVFAACGNITFAGTFDRGVYCSTNNGTSWKSVNSGLSDTMVSSLQVIGGSIFAGTLHGGVWRRPISEVVGVFDQRPGPELPRRAHFTMTSQYRVGLPVAVEFTVPHPARVVIKMYDPAGKEVSTLVRQCPDRGAYRALWDTRSLAPGCYAIRLQAGVISWIKTVQIMR